MADGEESMSVREVLVTLAMMELTGEVSVVGTLTALGMDDIVEEAREIVQVEAEENEADDAREPGEIPPDDPEPDDMPEPMGLEDDES